MSAWRWVENNGLTMILDHLGNLTASGTVHGTNVTAMEAGLEELAARIEELTARVADLEALRLEGQKFMRRVWRCRDWHDHVIPVPWSGCWLWEGTTKGGGSRAYGYHRLDNVNRAGQASVSCGVAPMARSQTACSFVTIAM